MRSSDGATGRLAAVLLAFLGGCGWRDAKVSICNSGLKPVAVEVSLDDGTTIWSGTLAPGQRVHKKFTPKKDGSILAKTTDSTGKTKSHPVGYYSTGSEATWAVWDNGDPARDCFPPSGKPRVRVQMRSFIEARFSWGQEVGPCPGTVTDLIPRWGGPETDPWGNEYVFLCGDDAPEEAKGFGVVSKGPDGQLGGSDDLRSWELLPGCHDWRCE
jgi:hypothetical protein